MQEADPVPGVFGRPKPMSRRITGGSGPFRMAWR